jgi:hypothetical protein
MKLLTLSKLMDYFENIVIDFNKSGPNGFEFELFGGRCRTNNIFQLIKKYGKSYCTFAVFFLTDLCFFSFNF